MPTQKKKGRKRSETAVLLQGVGAIFLIIAGLSFMVVGTTEAALVLALGLVLAASGILLDMYQDLHRPQGS